jgi:major membrane immunogen (membrane-anchored lipoprotein)
VALSVEEQKSFRKWYAQFDANQWDNDFEQDVKNGKLSKLAQKAISDFKKGNFKEL